jgi:hypothetical protein
VQTLGLSDSTPKAENRLKTLFWPAIRHETDVDHVTRQGFWVCLVVACLTLVLGAFQGPAFFVGGCLDAAFFFLSGVGVRMRSVLAAACAFLVYLLTTFVAGFGGVRLVFIALLLANLRGTWLSARWRASQTEPPPVPLSETLADKLSDQLPISIWPVGRFFYYILAALEIVFIVIGTFTILQGRRPNT